LCRGLFEDICEEMNMVIAQAKLRVSWTMVAFCLFQVPTFAQQQQDETSARRVWSQRHSQLRTAQYRTTWVDQELDGPAESRREGTLEADIAADQRIYRFDIGEKESKRSLLLDKDGFHTKSVRASSEKETMNEDEPRSTSLKSPWIHAYPLLLSHGLVPLPPFSHAGMMKTLDMSTPNPADTPLPAKPSNATELRWSDPNSQQHEQVRVRSSGGLVTQFEIWNDTRRVLQISVSYGKFKGVTVASRYVIEWFDDNGKANRRVEGQVTTLQLSKTTATTASAPHTKEAILTALTRQWDRELRVKPIMTVDGLVALLQETLGKEVHVRIDEEAFHKPFEFEKPDLLFAEDVRTVADLLLGDLPATALDFVVNEQGLTIIPRHVAWQSPEGRTYAAKDYGLSVDELRSLLHNSANAEDWDDLGGPGSLETDEETGSVVVIHTQSQHIRYSRELRQLQEARKQ
jgi:nuclear transport factor 2 (NTF2) superfamily protein